MRRFIPPKMKENIIKRDKGKCRYCGKEGGHIDHVIPVFRGGGSTYINLVTSCPGCNYSKRHKYISNKVLLDIYTRNIDLFTANQKLESIGDTRGDPFGFGNIWKAEGFLFDQNDNNTPDIKERKNNNKDQIGILYSKYIKVTSDRGHNEFVTRLYERSIKKLIVTEKDLENYLLECIERYKRSVAVNSPTTTQKKPLE